MNTLSFYLKKAEEFLRLKGIEKPRLEAQIIFAHLLGIQRIELYMNDHRPLEPQEIQAARELISRKGRGEPTAYITGTREFFSRSFRVDSSTLIPRPETEELIEWVLQAGHSRGRICDIGTGSGNIALTLLLESEAEYALMTDCSSDTLNVAQANAERLAAAEHSAFLQSDLFSSFNEEDVNSFNLIISNPPYIPPVQYKALDSSVRDYEPEKALLLKNRGDFFRQLTGESMRFLIAGGWIYLEINPLDCGLIQQLMAQSGYQNIEIRADYSERNHFIRGQKPG